MRWILLSALLSASSLLWGQALSQEAEEWIQTATEAEKEEAILRLVSALETLDNAYKESLESSRKLKSDYETTINRLKSEIESARESWMSSEASFEKSLREAEQKLRSCGTKVTVLTVISGVLLGALSVSLVQSF